MSDKMASSLETLQESLMRRIEKLNNLGDGENTKRQKKREFAEIGKLRKKIALSQVQKRSRLEDDSERIQSTIESQSKKQKGRSEETPPEKHIKLSNSEDDLKRTNKKSAKGVLKSMNNKLSQLSNRKQFKQAHKSFLSLAKRGISGNVHTFSILVNCAVRCGDLKQACKYFDEMRLLKISPNIVTVTTLLKGYCEAGDIKGAKLLLDQQCSSEGLIPNIRTVNTLLRGCVRCGEVEIAVAVFNSLVDWKLEPDETALTAISGLFCRVFRVEEAQSLISQSGGLVVGSEIYVSLSLSLALLGRWEQCQEALNMAETSLIKSETDHTIENKFLVEAKDEFGNNSLNEGDVRKSVKLFNSHKQGEFSKITAELQTICSQRLLESPGLSLKRSHLSSVLSQLIPLSEEENKQGVAFETFSRLISQFGLDTVCSSAGSSKQKKQRLQEVRDHVEGYFDPNGRIAFDKVLKKKSQEATKVKLEICSGHGEWISQQAAADPESHWVALELRHDRVFQTVARKCLEGVDNLSVIGPSDARGVLQRRISPRSVDAIFINHPEPPERTGGSEDSEGNHLLNSEFFCSMCRVLKISGTLTIVTDNQPYALSLAKTASNLPFLENAVFLERHHCQELVTSVGGIDVFSGKPGTECGHMHPSSSFFDRMWKNGRKVKRFTLYLTMS